MTPQKELQKVSSNLARLFHLFCTVVFALRFLASDYNLTQPAELVLFAGENRTCTYIMTTDDEIYEADESFFATLTSANEGVVITISSAAILITDDDGTYVFASSLMPCFILHLLMCL